MLFRSLIKSGLCHFASWREHVHKERSFATEARHELSDRDEHKLQLLKTITISPENVLFLVCHAHVDSIMFTLFQSFVWSWEPALLVMKRALAAQTVNIAMIKFNTTQCLLFPMRCSSTQGGTQLKLSHTTQIQPLVNVLHCPFQICSDSNPVFFKVVKSNNAKL